MSERIVRCIPWLIGCLSAIGCASSPALARREIPYAAAAHTSRVVRHTPPAMLTWIHADGADDDAVRLDSLPTLSPTITDDVRSEFSLTAELEPSRRDEWGLLGRSFADDVASDYAYFYSQETVVPLLAGLAVGASLANTHADLGVRDFYQDNVRNTATDDWSEALHTPSVLGNGFVTLPVFAAASLGGRFLADSPGGEAVGEWGDRSLRAFIVGAPPMFALQYLTGGSRPDESPHGSSWQPLGDSNGVSGHSFMGALPFLTAARMTDDPWLRAGLIGASTLPGLSRINDDAHFTSQVVVGWWIAYLASAAVEATVDERRSWRVVPLPQRDGFMLGLEYVR